MSDAPDLDLQQVLREIDEEVRARRASGEFPPGMERELDLLFARFAPPTVTGDDLDGLLEAADRTSYIDHHPPTASSFAPLSLIKRVEWKLFGWFFRFVTQQVTAFAGIVVQALRLLGRRVDALEHATPGADATQRQAAIRPRGGQEREVNSQAAQYGELGAMEHVPSRPCPAAARFYSGQPGA